MKINNQENLYLTHYGEENNRYYNSVTPPVCLNSLYLFNTMEEYRDYDKYDDSTYFYGRAGNPTVHIVEDKVAKLEHGAKAAVFSSGMAAATTVVLDTCKAKSHIVCVKTIYSPLRDFLENYCVKQLDMSLTFVDGENIEEFENAVTDKTDLIVLESPSSIVFRLQDLENVAKIAKKHNARTYVDNTYCSPLFQSPIDLGIDYSMNTMSKYMGGHSDIIGGVVASANKEYIYSLINKRRLLGGVMGPMEAWLVMRGLRTLKVRMLQYEKTATEVATYLDNHPKISVVNYPGLPSHPQYELAKRQQRGNGGLLSFEIDGSVEQSIKFINNLKIFGIACSWGGHESLAVMPELNISDEESKWMKVSNKVIRMYCGLEGSENLIADIEQALKNI